MDATALQALFEFTEADLSENRLGRLTARQQGALREGVRQQCIGLISVLCAVPFIIAAILLYFQIVLAYGDALGPLVCVLIIFWWAILPALIFYGITGLARYILQRALRSPTGWLCRVVGRGRFAHMLATIDAGRVIQLSGHLTLEDDGEHQFLFLNGDPISPDTLHEDDDRLWVLPRDRAYTFYYLPVYRWIVAAEFLV